MNYIIITTHGNLLRSYFSFISNKYSKHFNNCSIIKCYINNNFIHFKMIFEGYNNDNKNNNFTINEFNSNNYSIYNSFNFNNNTIIYLIRHGRALHNVINYIDKFFDKKYYDPKLTLYGEEQALNISNIIIDDIFKIQNNDNIKIKYGSSCLLRAIQTNLIIKKNIEKYININNKNNNKKQNLYIIPNINEIIYINQYIYNLGIFEYLLNNIYYTNKLNYNYHLKNKNYLYGTKIIWKYFFNDNYIINNICNLDIFYYINKYFKYR